MAVLAGFFQLTGDGFSLGFVLAFTISFFWCWPTPHFLSAKSFTDNEAENGKRSKFKLVFMLAATALLGLWFGYSPRLAALVKKYGLRYFDGITNDHIKLINSPKSLLILIISILLDFLGKSVMTKIFFCDVLLDMCMNTELQQTILEQDVMREEVTSLYQARAILITRMFAHRLLTSSVTQFGSVPDHEMPSTALAIINMKKGAPAMVEAFDSNYVEVQSHQVA